jgi:hypothetical protein
MAMKYVQLYYTYREVVSKLSYEEKGMLFDAILDYGEHGTLPELTGRADVVFPTFAMLIDRDKVAYADKCRRMKDNAEKRWHANECNGIQEEEKENKEEKEKDTHSVRYGRARGKRRLKNNSEITLRREDMFIPFWEVEGLDDEDEQSDAQENVLLSEKDENGDIM